MSKHFSYILIHTGGAKIVTSRLEKVWMSWVNYWSFATAGLLFSSNVFAGFRLFLGKKKKKMYSRKNRVFSPRKFHGELLGRECRTQVGNHEFWPKSCSMITKRTLLPLTRACILCTCYTASGKEFSPRKMGTAEDRLRAPRPPEDSASEYFLYKAKVLFFTLCKIWSRGRFLAQSWRVRSPGKILRL